MVHHLPMPQKEKGIQKCTLQLKIRTPIYQWLLKIKISWNILSPVVFIVEVHGFTLLNIESIKLFP